MFHYFRYFPLFSPYVRFSTRQKRVPSLSNSCILFLVIQVIQHKFARCQSRKQSVPDCIVRMNTAIMLQLKHRTYNQTCSQLFMSRSTGKHPLRMGRRVFRIAYPPTRIRYATLSCNNLLALTSRALGESLGVRIHFWLIPKTLDFWSSLRWSRGGEGKS